MKKLFTLAAFILATIQYSHAKIWRVNNIAGITADFNNANTAVNSALVVNGDTIHIEPSPSNYGNISLGKQLVIIGEGYLLDPANGGNTGLQAQIYTSLLSGIYFSAGASGSRLIGINTSYYPTWTADSVNNLTLEKCAIYGFDPNGYHGRNLSLRKCYVYGPLYFQYGTQQNTDIENCLLLTTVYTSSFTTGCIIRNCVIDAYTVNINNCYFANNICNSGGISLANSIVKNNFFSNTPAMPAGAVNNTFNTALTALVNATGSSDAYYQLKTGSAAIGAGVTLSGYTPDCGAFGGPDPYKLSGIPSVPSIYQLTVPSSIPLNTPSMNVTISTRNNN